MQITAPAPLALKAFIASVPYQFTDKKTSLLSLTDTSF